MFINIISTWWHIVNVKTSQKGRRLNYPFEYPVTSENNEPKRFLLYMLEWLKKWETFTVAGGRLTKETFSALSHTTHALLEIAEYCITELGAKYVLLGKFQTDSLEARFGQYRQLSLLAVNTMFQSGRFLNARRKSDCSPFSN